MIHLPKISIITPVYNRVDMLEQTIQSVLSQGYPNLEYIIIDGGSTDGTVEIIRKYADKLTYWVSEKDNGMYHAIQKGMEHATGDVLAWLNSDDMYHTNALQIVGEVFATLPDVEWIVGTPTMYNAAGQCAKVFPSVRWSWKKFKSGRFRWIQQESTFFRRSLWEKAGGKLELNYKLAADFELWVRFFQYAQLHTVSTMLGGFRLHGAQLSINQTERYEQEVQTVCEQYGMCYKLCCVKLMSIVNRLISERRLYKLPALVIYDFDNKKWMV